MSNSIIHGVGTIGRIANIIHISAVIQMSQWDSESKGCGSESKFIVLPPAAHNRKSLRLNIAVTPHINRLIAIWRAFHSNCTSTAMTASDFPVLVVSSSQPWMRSRHSRLHQVGGGPSGLAVALALLRNGIPVRIVDKEPHYRIGQRANGVWVSLPLITFELNSQRSYNSLARSKLSTF